MIRRVQLLKRTYKLCLASCLFFCTLIRADGTPFLASIPLTPDSELSLPLGSQISFSMSTALAELNQARLSKNTNTKILETNPSSLKLALKRSATLSEPPQEKHTQASFVIDIDERNTQAFLEGFKLDKTEGASLLDKILRYSNAYIETPTYVHGFLIASRIAQDKSGDCTEFAVLSTSLARYLGLPARYVTGLVILEEHQQLKAFGHAWSEVWFENKWHIIDAALLGLKSSDTFYLPIAELENEGPGYAKSLLSAIRYFPTKIENLTSS